MSQEHEELIQRLENHGEATVRSLRASGSWIWIDAQRVDLWLSSKDSEREAASSAKRDAREEETLAIAKEANAIARLEAAAASRSARYAMYAAIIAAIGAITAVAANRNEIVMMILGQ